MLSIWLATELASESIATQNISEQNLACRITWNAWGAVMGSLGYLQEDFIVNHEHEQFCNNLCIYIPESEESYLVRLMI
jgi:hypothetical protein